MLSRKHYWQDHGACCHRAWNTSKLQSAAKRLNVASVFQYLKYTTQVVKRSGQSTYLALIKSIYPHPVFLTYLIPLCCFFLAVLFLSFYSTFSVYFSSFYFCVSFLKSIFLAAFLFIPVQHSLIYFIIIYYPHLLHYSYFCLLYFYFPSFRFLCLFFFFPSNFIHSFVSYNCALL